MEHHPTPHPDRPLDLEEHEGEGRLDVWRRRLLFVLLIGLCFAFAAPTFGSCSGPFGSGGSTLWGTFTVRGTKHEVRDTEFQRAAQRLGAVKRLDPQSPDARITDDEVWAQLLLDEAAKAEGIHVSDEQVTARLASIPAFQTDGKFDESKYREEIRAMSRYTQVDHDGVTWALKSLLRTEIYRSVYVAAFAIPESRAAYDDWKTRNLKLTVDCVVQPYEALREQARQLPVTEPDLQRALVLPDAVKLRTVPARRGIEAAYVHVRDITDEHRAEMEALNKLTPLFAGEDSLESAAWNQFWESSKPDGAYTRDTWLALQRPRHEAELKAWEARPEPRGEKPADPAATMWPERPADQFTKHWQDFTTKEVLAREVLRQMALRAERESKSFADLAPDFAKYGIRVVATPEALAEDELETKFPEGLGSRSELSQIVRSRFRAPESGGTFVPRVAVDPFPATAIVRDIAAHGWIVLRWSSLEPAREKPIDEIREPLTEIFKSYRASELARDVLGEIRRKVEETEGDAAAKSAALRKLAAEKGLPLIELRRFNERTPRPRTTTPGADASADEKAAILRGVWRSRVQDEYTGLSKAEVGKFRDPVLLDDTTAAGYLMFVVAKEEPKPIEMDEASVQREQQMRFGRAVEAFRELLAPAALKRKFALELTEEGRKATERATPEDAGQ